MKNVMKMALLMAAGMFFLAGTASADVAQIKIYKEAFPDLKPKCIDCHTLALPKKDAHELNDYGKKLTAIDEKPTVETYKKVGNAGESNQK